MWKSSTVIVGLGEGGRGRDERKAGCLAGLESSVKLSQQPHPYRPFPQPVWRGHERPIVAVGGRVGQPYKFGFRGSVSYYCTVFPMNLW